jgi:hypothetical protein
MNPWISPAQAMKLVYDDPAGTGPDADFGFAMLWARTRDGGETRNLTDLVRAKLQPRRPTEQEMQSAGAPWPVTAWDHRLVLADGVPDPDSPQALFEAYDRATLHAPPTLLAIVQTLRFEPGLFRHEMMHAAYMYVASTMQPRRLSSLVIQHMPGDARSARRPHVHVVTPCLEHTRAGFGQGHALFNQSPTDMHLALQAEWHRFRDAHARSAG